MIVAYATQAGRTAEDGTGHNSPYTTAFLKHIDEKEEIGSVFRRVSADVYETTRHQQLPELSLSLIGEFYLRGKIDLTNKPEDTAARDFEAAERVNSSAGWDAFLKQHPDKDSMRRWPAKSRRRWHLTRPRRPARKPARSKPMGPMRS